jgi:hypothetical protein
VGIFCSPPIFPDFDIGLGFTINNGGFSVDLPWTIPDIDVGGFDIQSRCEFTL